jgi:hypothetical protein
MAGGRNQPPIAILANSQNLKALASAGKNPKKNERAVSGLPLSIGHELTNVSHAPFTGGYRLYRDQ